MKDIFDQRLNIGDVVAFNRPIYRGLMTGKIIAFTPKQVRVEFACDNHLGQGKGTNNTTCYPKDVVKRIYGNGWVTE